jgi:hypothetical protein
MLSAIDHAIVGGLAKKGKTHKQCPAKDNIAFTYTGAPTKIAITRAYQNIIKPIAVDIARRSDKETAAIIHINAVDREAVVAIK